MVNLTIYVEGGNVFPQDNDASQTIDNSAFLREGFHTLFSKRLPEEKLRLSIQPFGTVTQAAKQLKKITEYNLNAIILIDLDAPKNKKQERLDNNYSGLDFSKLFFMIQEMEAFILSQPDTIERYYINKKLKLKKDGIKNNPLIKGIHPELIVKPSEKLNTILSQHFDEEKFRKGVGKFSPKRYSKNKDGPALIGILDIEELISTFDEVQNLINHLESANY